MNDFKKCINDLALMKYNELQLYMENLHCFKYKAYPKYTQEVETLTGEDIEELDRYCWERFSDLVPNQNSLGHLHEWKGQPEFKHMSVGDEEVLTNTINILMFSYAELVLTPDSCDEVLSEYYGMPVFPCGDMNTW